MGLKVNHLNNLPINNSGQSLQQLITYYNSHNPRARLISLKTQTKEVIAQYRDDQGIDNSHTQTVLGPNFVYRSKKWFTAQLGVGQTLEKGPAWPEDKEQPPMILMYAIGAYFGM